MEKKRTVLGKRNALCVRAKEFKKCDENIKV
jgi:hypothetical protein